MPIRQSDLYTAGYSRYLQGQFSKRSGQPTAFLSHGVMDATSRLVRLRRLQPTLSFSLHGSCEP